MNGALECTHPPCRRKIYHPSGRCQDHRSAQSERDRLRSSASVVRTVSTPPPLAVVPLRESIPAPVAEVEPIVEVDEENVTVARLPDGGTHTVTRDDGVIMEEWKNAAGVLHRTDGPAQIGIGRSGVVESEGYYRNGRLHRPVAEGPAVVIRNSDGSLRSEDFSVNGLAVEGLDPHYVTYDPDGSVSEKLFYFDNAAYSSPSQVAEALFDHPAERALEEVRKSRFGALLDEGHEHGRIVEVLAQGVSSIEGVREVLGGTPAEWVRSYEESQAAR